MRLAVISDIHGNIVALKAVLADLKTRGVDDIVNLGDCVTGLLWQRETLERDDFRLARLSRSSRTKEPPRLCRGGSKSLTIPAVAPQAPSDETLNRSRRAHERNPIDGQGRFLTLQRCKRHQGAFRVEEAR